MKNYETTYAKWRAWLESHPVLTATILFLNRHITHLMYILYPALLVYMFYFWREKLLFSILIPGLGFVSLSLVRRWLNAPRPYEVFDIVPLIAKNTKGQSMPSRHIFSATMISMCALQVNIFLGIFSLILSLFLAVSRVLVGVHFPKDVVVGMAIGLLLGALLFYF